MAFLLAVLFRNFFAGKVLRPFICPKVEFGWGGLIFFHAERPLEVGKTAAKIEIGIRLWDGLFDHKSIAFGVYLRLNLRLEFFELDHSFLVLLHQVA